MFVVDSGESLWSAPNIERYDVCSSSYTTMALVSICNFLGMKLQSWVCLRGLEVRASSYTTISSLLPNF